MDEVLFRSSQRLESLQLQFGIASQNAANMIEQYSATGREMAIQALNSPRSEQIQRALREFVDVMREYFNQAKEATLEIVNPAAVYGQLAHIFKDELARNNAFYLCMGLTIGGIGGVIIGSYCATPALTPNVMKAVVAISYRGIDTVTYSTAVTAPLGIQRSNDILIRVKAACLQRVDEKIASGYARNLRQILCSNKTQSGFPVVLGRSCSGIVEAVGDTTRFEIGDEVWVVSPLYGPGLASELVLVPQNSVSRKPRIIGFEGAASLPYSGSIALMALESANLDENTSINKRIYIQGGCSPVGCVLGQLLHLWKANVTVSCATRAMPVAKALGATAVIPAVPIDEFNISSTGPNQLLKELALQEPFDAVFITTEMGLKLNDCRQFLNKDGIVIETFETELLSDNFGFVMQCFYSTWLKLKQLVQVLTGINVYEANGQHLCYVNLDKLSTLVDSSQLQTVVDKVFSPNDSETALSHVCSDESIGNTVITFR